MLKWLRRLGGKVTVLELQAGRLVFCWDGNSSTRIQESHEGSEHVFK